MAAKRLLSCSTLPCLRTCYSAVRFNAQGYNNRLLGRKPSLLFQTSAVSTGVFGGKTLKAYPQKITHLPGFIIKARSIYGSSCSTRIDSLPCLTKRTKLVHSSFGLFMPVRCINERSKLGKRKTCKAVAKRFLRTGKGKLKRWKSGKSHRMMHKRKRRRRDLSKPTYVNKQQLKLLNKMLNGW